MSAIHSLKTWPQFFRAVAEGRKTFEVRKADRPFAVGDVLVLQEWNPETQEYTREMVSKRITYRMDGPAFGIEAGTCVLGLGPIAARTPGATEEP